jgi:hypothetical protein
MATRSSNRLNRGKGASAQPAKKSVKRPAPPIAAENADAARRNIAAKLDILGDFLSLSAGEMQSATSPAAQLKLSDLPRSVRQFNGWNSASLRPELQSLFAPFSNNSNATLRKHAALHELAVGRIEAIGNVTHQSGAKQESRAALLRQVSLANRLRVISEKELIRSRRELADERSKIESLESELVSTTAKFKEEMKELKRQVSSLKSENSRLAALVRNAPKLRAV